MAKVLCAYSGINFTVEHFPISLTSREACHPIFDVPQKRLLGYLGKWSAGELTQIDSYLLFLALLQSSGNVQFRVPVYRHDLMNSLVANNMEALARTVIKLNSVTNPHVVFPSFAITPETRGLLNIHHWIEAWRNEYQNFIDGYVSFSHSIRLVRRESALERMIKNPFKEQKDYASTLAEWAAEAGTFPVSQTEVSGKQVALAEYWKRIIIACSNETGLYSIPIKDIIELLEHCEETIPIGSIFSNKLFSTLRRALDKQENFLGTDRGNTTFQILGSDDTIEDANISAIVQRAPKEEPSAKQFPTKIAYLKALLSWRLAQKYAGPGSSDGKYKDI